MLEIPLTKRQTAFVDDEDSDLLQLKWQAHKGKRNNTWYASRYYWDKGTRRYRHESMHRLILARKLGVDLVSLGDTDHINRNGLDNRRSNLRVIDDSLNQVNRSLQKNNTSGFKGVSFRKDNGKWRARIGKGNKRISLGQFETFEEAVEMYKETAINLFGDYACLD